MINNRKKRIENILNKIKLLRTTSIDELSGYFGVSGATIRRDLKQLEDEGIILQTVGGGVVFKSAAQNPGRQEEATSYINEKIRIAEYCIGLVNEYDDIVIGPGTTTYLVGKILSGITDRNFRIITNSLELAIELSGINNIQVVVPGGIVVEKLTVTFEGYPDFFEKYRKDHKTFISVDGIDIKNGLTVFQPQCVGLLKQLIEVSSEIILVGNSRKFEKTGFYFVSGLEKVKKIITDSNLSPAIKEQFTQLGIEVITV